MAAEENRFVTYIISSFPVQEGILRNKTWQDFSETLVVVFNKTSIPLALVGYEIIIANSTLCASLAIYHPISNARSFM